MAGGAIESTDALAARATGEQRSFTAALLVLVAVAAGLGLWDRAIETADSKLAAVHTAELSHIEKVTSLRRDARKTYVALLESWLLPVDRRGDRRAALEQMIEMVRVEQREFVALPPTEPAEAPIQARLDTALTTWSAVVSPTPAEQRGASELDAVAAALLGVDTEAEAVLGLNSRTSAEIDVRIADLAARRNHVRQGFAVTLFAAAGVFLYGRARARAEHEARDAQKREEARAARLRAEFFASMSHELRTPLVAIRNLATKLDASDSSLVESRDVGRHIEAEARDLLAMINNILDFAKLESEHVELLIEDLSLSDVVNRCVKRCAPLIEERPIELRVEIPASLPKVRADFVKLQQVFTNLLANAIKFTERGHVTVRATARDDGAIEVCVEDTGIGIEAAALASIWDAFRQADSRAVRKFGGTGLGLAIVRGVMTKLGGEVSASSVVGQGTVFTVILPRGDRAPR